MKKSILVSILTSFISVNVLADISDPEGALNAFSADTGVISAIATLRANDSTCTAGNLGYLQTGMTIEPGHAEYQFIVSQVYNCLPSSQKSVSAVVILSQGRGTRNPQPIVPTVNLLSL